MSHLAGHSLACTSKAHDRCVRAICRECVLGCGLVVYLRGRSIVDVHGDVDHPVSGGRICARGITFIHDLANTSRITKPLMRKGLQDPFEQVDDWERVLDLCAEKIRKIRDQHGPDAVAIHCDRGAGLDFVLGAIRFAKLLGAPNIYHDLSTGFSGYPAPPPSFEWPECGPILFVCADVAAAHPVAFGRALEAQRRGAKLLSAESLFTRTMAKADRAWRIKPRSGNLLGIAINKMLIEQGFDAAAGSGGPDDWMDSYERLEWDGLLDAVGLRREELKELCGIIAGAGPGLIVTGKALAEGPYFGVWPGIAASLGWTGGKSGGWYPLSPVLPPLDVCRDLDGTASFDVKSGTADPSGPVKAILGSAVALNDLTSLASGELDLTVCFGSFPGNAHKLSHVYLPAPLWPERNNLHFTSDRVVHWCEKIVDPEPGCRSGLDLWLGLAGRLGWADAFAWVDETGMADTGAFFKWALESFEAANECGPIHLGESRDGSINFWTLDRENAGEAGPGPTYAPAEAGSYETEDPGYPLYFQPGEPLTRSGEGAAFRPWNKEMEREDLIQVHPDTAATLGIENGDEVVISFSGGTRGGLAWISRCVPEGVVSATFRLGSDWVQVRKKDLD